MISSHQCIVKPVGGGAMGPGADIGGGNQTIATVLELPQDALWVRLRFTCWSPIDVAIAGAVYAASAALGNAFAAYDEAGEVSADLWRPVTFGKSDGCIAQLGEAANEVRGFTLSAIGGNGPADFEPRILVSDWLPFQPLTRRDGAGGLIAVRMHVPAEHPPFRLGYAAAPAVGRAIGGSYSFGDNASPPYGGYSEPYPVTVIHGLDVICVRPVRTLIIVGDSIASGDCSTGGGTCYGLIAAVELAGLGVRITPAILANPAQNSEAYLRNAYRYLADVVDELAGSIIVIQSWSGNDPQTLAGAATCFRGALALASFCSARGLTPVLATAAPVAMAPEHEDGRALGNRLARGSGLPCLDIDRIAGTGETPNRYQPGMAADDNVHLADTGQFAVARELVALIQNLLAAGEHEQHDQADGGRL